ncbi:MAG TPA: ATP-binding protein [Terriglobales bacterium]|nr:ATP-binding protein [Terriglobales bacterium]
MTTTGSVLARAWRHFVSVLPQGHGLPAADWNRRHAGMLFVLWAHAAGIFLYVLVLDRDPLHALAEGGVVAIAGLFASQARLGRRVQALCACLGLLTSSGILVHLSGGYIEMHFHFFVMVPLMALYQDWMPFLAAIAYVVLHHGTIGVLDPGQVYNHPAALAAPWTWAAIHGVFVLATSVVACIMWRLNELARADATAAAQRFGGLVQSLDAVVWEAEPAMNRFSFMSRQIEALVGVPAARWQSEPGLWERLIHPEDRRGAVAAYAAIVAGGSGNDVAYRLTAADGRIVHVSDIVHVMRDEAGVARRLRGVTVDMTARRGLEEQLRQSQKLEAIGRLAGGVAHDFNNLLSVIIGRVELLRELVPSQDRTLELIAATSMRGAALTRQLLAFGRQQVLQPRVIDLAAAVQNLAPMLRRLVREDIEMLFEASGIAHVEADPVQVDQVLLNLVVNAGDAMPRGGRLTIEVAPVELDAEARGRRVGAPPGRYVALRVADTGLGMDEATLARIFEPFFTTKAIGRGTGLGLATVYGVVTQSNGDIRVESAPGRGTSFTVYLPRVDEPVSEAVSAQVVRPATEGASVLLVEDDTDLRALVGDILVDRGYHVSVAKSPDDALAILDEAAGRIDLLVTDVVMPGMNGIELAARVAEKSAGTKVLFITGYAPEMVAGGAALRGKPLLEKPFTPNDLAARVREVLEG